MQNMGWAMVRTCVSLHYFNMLTSFIDEDNMEVDDEPGSVCSYVQLQYLIASHI